MCGVARAGHRRYWAQVGTISRPSQLTPWSVRVCSLLDKPRVDCTLALLVPWCVDKNLRFPSVGHFISNINISPI